MTVCPTTGLRIDQHSRARKRKGRKVSPDRAAEQRRMVGRIIDDKYRLIAAIGEGGMSSIYEAEHRGLDRRVAIKVLHPSLSDDPEAIARLRHEAKVVSAIGHPNICEVFDLGRTPDGSPYLVMELLRGESLADRIKSVGSIHFLELAPLLKQVLKALDAAHDKGILHRDLKPENVFIEEARHSGRQQAKLLDFGISKSMGYDFIENQRLTHTGMVMGTPYYMAPEQARGDSGLDQRVDLWAIGVMMYEALTGRRPFVATNYNALLVKILTSRPRSVLKLDPNLPPDVAAIIDKALSKLREDRYQTARQFIDAIARVERKVAAEDPHAPTMMMRRRPVRRVADTRPEPVSVPPAGWKQAIEDPSTFIDDDVYPSAHELAAAQRDKPSHRPPATWEGYEASVEPTIQDRLPEGGWEEEEVYEPHPASSRASETDIMVRSVSDEDPTEVMDRAKLLAQARMKIASEDDTLPTNVKSPMASREKPTFKKTERRNRRAAAPKAPATSRRPVKAKKRGKPGVPRPDVPDDEEKTTLFDVEAARKKLAARNQRDPD